MGYFREINITISGQIKSGDDNNTDRDYETCQAELNLIAKKYGLDIKTPEI